MSQLKVNSIIPVGGLPSGANGGVIQVVQTVRTSIFSETVTQGNESSILLGTNITPSSSSSKVLVQACIQMGLNTTHGRAATLKRGSTSIFIGDASDSRRRVSGGGSSTNSSSMTGIHFSFLDSPATTSAVTYGFTLSHCENGTLTVYLNRTDNDGNGPHIPRTASSLTLFEVTT